MTHERLYSLWQRGLENAAHAFPIRQDSFTQWKSYLRLDTGNGSLGKTGLIQNRANRENVKGIKISITRYVSRSAGSPAPNAEGAFVTRVTSMEIRLGGFIRNQGNAGKQKVDFAFKYARWRTRNVAFFVWPY